MTHLFDSSTTRRKLPNRKVIMLTFRAQIIGKIFHV